MKVEEVVVFDADGKRFQWGAPNQTISLYVRYELRNRSQNTQAVSIQGVFHIQHTTLDDVESKKSGPDAQLREHSRNLQAKLRNLRYMLVCCANVGMAVIPRWSSPVGSARWQQSTQLPG